jgi:hypothetical protein
VPDAEGDETGDDAEEQTVEDTAGERTIGFGHGVGVGSF